MKHISWTMVLVLCLTVGLAPYLPEPHIWQKLKMLFDGNLSRPVDIADLVFHGAPWVLALLKVLSR